MKDHILWQIAATFLSLSLVAIGGAAAVLPEMHLHVVDTMHWMTGETLANLFALAQTAPGANILIVSLIGWHVAGWTGLAVATVAMVLPASLLSFGVGRVVTRYAALPWIRTVQDGLVPIAVGLILASGTVMAQAVMTGPIGRDILALAIAGGTALFVFGTSRNPFWALGTGALLSIAAFRLGLTT